MTDVLLVDDNRVIRERYAALFAGEGYVVRTARDGVEALARFAEHRPDVTVLDVAMPRMNGFAACREIRKQDPSAPVLFLTANATEVNEIRGFDLGADDFVAKDASETVLLARIRRAVGRPRPAVALAERTLQLGKVAVDLDLLKVSGKGVSEMLTHTEGIVLELLASDRGRYFSVEEIITRLHGSGFVCEDSMAYVHVSNLRRKLGPAGEMIVSLRRMGYRLVK